MMIKWKLVFQILRSQIKIQIKEDISVIAHKCRIRGVKNYFNSDRKKLKHIHRQLLDVTSFVIYQVYTFFKVQRKFKEYQSDLSTASTPFPYLQPLEPNDRNALTKLVRSKILRSSSNIRIGPREQPLANQLADHSSRTRWEVSVDNAPPVPVLLSFPIARGTLSDRCWKERRSLEAESSLVRRARSLHPLHLTWPASPSARRNPLGLLAHSIPLFSSFFPAYPSFSLLFSPGQRIGWRRPFRADHQSSLSICNGDSLCPSRESGPDTPAHALYVPFFRPVSLSTPFGAVRSPRHSISG